MRHCEVFTERRQNLPIATSRDTLTESSYAPTMTDRCIHPDIRTFPNSAFINDGKSEGYREFIGIIKAVNLRSILLQLTPLFARDGDPRFEAKTSLIEAVS